jgi:hypothetical protein
MCIIISGYTISHISLQLCLLSRTLHKSDGNSGLSSDHIFNAINLFSTRLAFLLMAVAIHGIVFSNNYVRVTWGGVVSNYVVAINGVKESGVLSPVFFLFKYWWLAGVGCFNGSYFVWALAYADDIALLAPSVFALRLFQSYRMSLYCCELWLLSTGLIDELCVAWHTMHFARPNHDLVSCGNICGPSDYRTRPCELTVVIKLMSDMILCILRCFVCLFNIHYE